MPHVKLPAGEFYYRYDGPADAPLLVLSNSLGTDHSMWDPQMPAFTKFFGVLHYDSRGHGASAAPPGPYTIADLGQDVLDLYRALVHRTVPQSPFGGARPHAAGAEPYFRGRLHRLL